MSILFVDSLINRKYEGPRAAVVSLASALRNSGVLIDLFPFYMEDMNMNLSQFRNNENKFVEEVAERSVNYEYLFLTGWTGSWKRMKKIAQEAKRNNPRLRIVAGGSHIDFTEMYRRNLPNSLDVLFQDSPEIDVFVYGESENTVIELIKKGYKGTRGLGYRSQTKVINNGWRPLEKDLDNLSFPRLKPEELENKKWIYIESARGCIYSCKFCSESLKWSNPTNLGVHRQKSSARIIDEIKDYQSHGIDHFRFTDSTLTFNSNLEEICDMIYEEGLSVSWSGFARVNEILKLPLNKMKEAGCETLLIGFESGSANKLKMIKKGYTIDQAYEAVSKLRNAGIKIRGSWIVGLPYESEEDFQKTIDFARALKLDANAVHAYEDQKTKFESYRFNPLDFELDMPNKAFGEHLASSGLGGISTEMHFLPRFYSTESKSKLSDIELMMYDRIRRFNNSVGNQDKDYDTKDRYDRKTWEKSS